MPPDVISPQVCAPPAETRLAPCSGTAACATEALLAASMTPARSEEAIRAV
jgi:hypothetical protein